MKTITFAAALLAAASVSYAEGNNKVDGVFITGINKHGNLETASGAVIIDNKDSRYSQGEIIFKKDQTDSGIVYNGNRFIQDGNKVIKIDENNKTATSERFDKYGNVSITNFR